MVQINYEMELKEEQTPWKPQEQCGERKMGYCLLKSERKLCIQLQIFGEGSVVLERARNHILSIAMEIWKLTTHPGLERPSGSQSPTAYKSNLILEREKSLSHLKNTPNAWFAEKCSNMYK